MFQNESKSGSKSSPKLVTRPAAKQELKRRSNRHVQSSDEEEEAEEEEEVEEVETIRKSRSQNNVDHAEVKRARSKEPVSEILGGFFLPFVLFCLYFKFLNFMLLCCHLFITIIVYFNGRYYIGFMLKQ